MESVYASIPTLENEQWLIRPLTEADASGLLSVYGDPAAMFNGDGCNGDDFHYTTMERMTQGLAFWLEAAPNGWFVRWGIVDKTRGVMAGTMEAFLRHASDELDDTVLLRLDVGSPWENREALGGILDLWLPKARAFFGGRQVATKAFAESPERRAALTASGFDAPVHALVGKDGTVYGGYAVCPLTGFVALGEQDVPQAQAVLSRAPEMNLFMLGDLANYGVTGAKVDLYALPDSTGAYSALLLRYETYWNLYCPDKKPNAREILAFLRGHKIDSFSAEQSDMEALLAYAPDFFAGKRISRDKLCCRRAVKEAPVQAPEGTELRFLTANEVEQAEALRQTIEEFADSYETAEDIARSLRLAKESTEMGELTCGLYAGGELAAIASTTASTAQSAMIVSVATRKGMRGRGYATTVMHALCQAAFSRGKQSLCLFYDNEEAGRIYRAMGFSYVGEYWMVS